MQQGPTDSRIPSVFGTDRTQAFGAVILQWSSNRVGISVPWRVTDRSQQADAVALRKPAVAFAGMGFAYRGAYRGA